MSSMMEITLSSSLVVSPTGRLTLGFQGKVSPVLPSTNAAGAVCFDLSAFVYPRIHSYPAIHSYPTIEFPLSRLSELRQLIALAISSDGQSVIRGDDHEVFEYLTDQATSFLNELMARRPSALDDASALYTIYADLFVDEDSSSPPEATATPAPTVDLLTLLRKVAYRNNEENAAEMVRETRCPICLQDFVEEEEVQVTPCRHPFHLLCLESSLQCKPECPLCRTPFP